jgi:hypothetical protein
MEFIWQYGEYTMSFIKKINWINLLVWVGLLTISFTIWYYIIKLIRSIV